MCTVLGMMTGPGCTTTENLAKASGRPVIYNAVTPAADQHGQPTQNAGRVMKWLREVNEVKGLRVFGQAITSTAQENNTNHFSLDIWNLFDASPPWRRITIGSPEEPMAKMRDPMMRGDRKAQFDNVNKTVTQLVADDHCAPLRSDSRIASDSEVLEPRVVSHHHGAGDG